MLAEMISKDLKMMCGYARGVLGNCSAAEEAVECILQHITDSVGAEGAPVHDRVALYALLNREVMARAVMSVQDRKLPAPLRRMSMDERRASFLVQYTNFSSKQAAIILDMRVEAIEALIVAAAGALESTDRMGVLIIEDEPHIARLLSNLVVDTGHWVAGVAQTHREAVDLAKTSEFGMIISDVVLAEGSMGPDAVNEISELRGAIVPTLFLTAYPWLVEGRIGDANSFLISKPFEVGNVRDVIGHAAWCARAA